MNRRTNLALPPQITRLLDPAEREGAMASFRDNNGSPELANTIRRNLVSPLERWANAEASKWGHHTGVDHAIKLAIKADDLAEKWSKGTVVIDEAIDDLDIKWRQLTEEMAFAGVTVASNISNILKISQPDINRGKKVLKGAQEAAEKANSLHKEKWPEYQLYIDELYKNNPRLTYADMQRLAAHKFSCATKTIQRNTSNPRQK